MGLKYALVLIAVVMMVVLDVNAQTVGQKKKTKKPTTNVGCSNDKDFKGRFALFIDGTATVTQKKKKVVVKHSAIGNIVTDGKGNIQGSSTGVVGNGDFTVDSLDGNYTVMEDCTVNIDFVLAGMKGINWQGRIGTGDNVIRALQVAPPGAVVIGDFFAAPDTCSNKTVLGTYVYNARATYLNKVESAYIGTDHYDGNGHYTTNQYIMPPTGTVTTGLYSVADNCDIWWEQGGAEYAGTVSDSGFVYIRTDKGWLDMGVANRGAV